MQTIRKLFIASLLVASALFVNPERVLAYNTCEEEYYICGENFGGWIQTHYCHQEPGSGNWYCYFTCYNSGGEVYTDWCTGF
jgi:hypothetical protein